ncbi:MFS transporter [Paraburkholderia sp. B3]|uniref:MFS transporter n=1 Tax=Paraburkholderia sp. B3 TaxID=3134791 RepID=UPI003981D1C5
MLFLGAAEAGLFPGAVLYLTYWFPARSRGQIMGIFYFGSPLALMLGGPLSGYLLEQDGLFGLQGWQLMFLVEGGSRPSSVSEPSSICATGRPRHAGCRATRRRHWAGC